MKRLLLILSFLFLTNSCFAADDPRLRVYPQQEAMVFKGLDEISSPVFLKDGYATTAKNVQFSSTGGLRKRYGYEFIEDLDRAGVDYQAITGLFYTKLSSGTAYRIATIGARFYSETGGTWTKGLDDTNTITYALNNQFVWTTALDNVIFTNNVDDPLRWSGTDPPVAVSFTGLTNPITKANCVAWFKNYLIFGNTTENAIARTTRIRWSNVGTINTWSDDDFIDIATLGGQQIEGFGILYDNLFVFMTDSIYKVSLVGGDEIFNISKMVEGTGCIAKNSIQNVAIGNSSDGILFLSKDKTINFFNGIGAVNASFYIPTTMDGLSTTRLQYAVSATDGDDYYLSVSNGTSSTNNLVIDINLDTGDISTHTNIFANAMTTVLDSDSDVQIYFGNYDSHVLQLYDSSKKNDVAGYTGTFESTGIWTSDVASGEQVIFDSEGNFACTGAIVTLVGGTGSGLQKVITGIHGATGIIVDSAFSTTPDSTTQYSIGAIDADYVTKWYSMGEPARRKHFGEMYLWVESDSGSETDINYAKDFGSYAGSQSVDLTGAGAVWGTAVWGIDVWGGEDALFKVIKLKGDGKFIKFRIQENDIDETFNIYGTSFMFFVGDIL